jgi:hypothetical protein
MSPLITAWFLLTLITFISVGSFLLVLVAPANQLLSRNQMQQSRRGRTAGLIMLASALLSFLSALAYIVFGS